MYVEPRLMISFCTTERKRERERKDQKSRGGVRKGWREGEENEMPKRGESGRRGR